jgi:CsoR family transcriptional regulator, copper-sensing transcriptional repressor
MHHEVREEHLIQRLNRIEGQVRGLRQMIENDRYSGDMAQQTSAISAAVREVTLLLISQHLEAAIPLVAENGGVNGPLDEEILGILRSAISRPTES